MSTDYKTMKKLTPDQIDRYLERIGYCGSREPTKAVLDELIWKHQLHIPFETLDCHDFRIGVDIDPEVIFEKLIVRGRGGHCLELNGAFFRLLTSLGFQVRPCLNRVLLGSDEFTHPIDHRTTLVMIEGREYYCDVGLGGPMPAGAMDIHTGNWQTMHGETYAVRPSEYEGWHLLCRQTPHGNHMAGTPEAMRMELMFTTTACFETDFIFLNHYMSTHPQAFHVAHRIVNLRTQNGYRMIEDDLYREFCRGEIAEEMRLAGNLSETLADKFGIHVSIG